MEHHLPLTGEQCALIEPLLSPNKSAAISQRESNVSMRFSGLDAYRILHVPDRRTERESNPCSSKSANTAPQVASTFVPLARRVSTARKQTWLKRADPYRR